MTHAFESMNPDRHSPYALRVERFTGDIDITASPMWSLALEKIADRGGAVVLDLSRVKFIGAAALSLLADFVHARNGEGLVTAVAAPDSVRHCLRLCDCTAAATVTDTVDDAVVAMRAQTANG